MTYMCIVFLCFGLSWMNIGPIRLNLVYALEGPRFTSCVGGSPSPEKDIRRGAPDICMRLQSGLWPYGLRNDSPIISWKRNHRAEKDEIWFCRSKITWTQHVHISLCERGCHPKWLPLKRAQTQTRKFLHCVGAVTPRFDLTPMCQIWPMFDLTPMWSVTPMFIGSISTAQNVEHWGLRASSSRRRSPLFYIKVNEFLFKKNYVD